MILSTVCPVWGLRFKLVLPSALVYPLFDFGGPFSGGPRSLCSVLLRRVQREDSEDHVNIESCALCRAHRMGAEGRFAGAEGRKIHCSNATLSQT